MEDGGVGASILMGGGFGGLSMISALRFRGLIADRIFCRASLFEMRGCHVTGAETCFTVDLPRGDILSDQKYREGLNLF